jgi:hypothetical protein
LSEGAVKMSYIPSVRSAIRYGAILCNIVVQLTVQCQNI